MRDYLEVDRGDDAQRAAAPPALRGAYGGLLAAGAVIFVVGFAGGLSACYWPRAGDPEPSAGDPEPSAGAAPSAGGAEPRMTCGEGVALCGVVALQSGFGEGKYARQEPAVHGLWPEVGAYGDSKCVPAADLDPPETLLGCYEDLDFQRHEFAKHGSCAGVADARAYVAATCALAAAPLSLMRGLPNIVEMRSAVEAAGYEVFHQDGPDHAQLFLSACKPPNGDWVLAPAKTFPDVCGGWPPVEARICVRHERGPACARDDECALLSGCLRCARSGFCTAEPMPARRTSARR